MVIIITTIPTILIIATSTVNATCTTLLGIMQ